MHLNDLMSCIHTAAYKQGTCKLLREGGRGGEGRGGEGRGGVNMFMCVFTGGLPSLGNAMV